MELSTVPYGHEMKYGSGGGNGRVRYKECMRNHAAAIGGHAFDGCGEFIAGGEDGGSGGVETLMCAACGCHRNFHCREDGGARRGPTLVYPYHQPLHSYLSAKAPYVAAPAPVGYGGVGVGEWWRGGTRTGPETPLTPPQVVMVDREGRGVTGCTKRQRTKFTAEQKEKMTAFAERVGWRVQKYDDAEVQEFCREVGVKRHVLKVWMHNNKSTLAGATKDRGGAMAGAAATRG